MTFLLKWLGLGSPSPAIGLRPHRDVELAIDYDRTYDRVLSAVELAIGANLTLDDRRGGMVEAAIGLVNSERVRCTLTRIDDAHTAVRIEAFFPAGVTVPSQSRIVDALADMLERPAPH